MIAIKANRPIIPMIYAYSTPQIAEHDGWIKIGYTEAQSVEDRIKQQTYTANIESKLEWKGAAIYEDGSGISFTDKDFHVYLKKCQIENKRGTEWFHISGSESKVKFYQFKEHQNPVEVPCVVPYRLRNEQMEAVRLTKNYYENNEAGEFLWNAKPRFGKTLSVYDFCKQINAKKILIVTNRPAIANSWYSDYVKFLGEPSGYRFVSETDSLRGEHFVLTRKQYIDSIGKGNVKGFIEFLSLQDLKGSIYFGGSFNKLKEIQELEWDVLVIDEAHEGVDTQKTDIAFDNIKRRFTLHLSGTPFKALANKKFPDDAIYNWTYADEQKAKRDWRSEEGEDNPYETLPRLNLFTYQMSEIVRDELERGIEIEGETEEYAFDLNEFFETKQGRFVHDASVSKFLDALTKQEKFPFSTDELRNELKHTFWLLNRVDSAKALAKKLREHPVFCQYEIVLAAGDGRLDETAEETGKAYEKVKNAIKQYEKTITLSVGQLTTGVTIPEWTAVLMLCNLHSPALYMQAAFRSQNPHMFYDGKYWRKENAYVFDFDPARTLTIFEEFANDLSLATANGRGDTETRKANVRELLNFFPVIGEDEQGEMIELDAEKVLSIPRKIRSQEVVRRGFMSNYLFQNISGIFSAPPEVIDIINKFEAVEEPKAKRVTPEDLKGLDIDPKAGGIDLTQETVIGKDKEVFGDKIYGEGPQEAVTEVVKTTVDQKVSNTDAAKKVADAVKKVTVTPIINSLKDAYGSEMKKSDVSRVQKVVENKVDTAINKVYVNHGIEQKKAEQDRLSELQNRDKTGKSEIQIEKEFETKQQELNRQLKEDVAKATRTAVDEAQKVAVQTVETKVQERKKDGIEGTVRDHLRGFSRTIPSFLMAYGNDQTTLKTFDTVVPDNVFKEVTSITLAQFRFLRDGGEYTDSETGERKHFRGNLFDSVVFDDSVKEFLRLKQKLADYFDEKNGEDIFDYIPFQKTNQIFTPKPTVKQMVDLLEQENPGCFDDPEKTFIDLYMKSGLYVTEIVKRLYNSAHMKEVFPNAKERLEHIFAKQVFGLAPTEIIYQIALAYILGFDETHDIRHHHFKMADALPYVKNGTLETMLDDLFNEK